MALEFSRASIVSLERQITRSSLEALDSSQWSYSKLGGVKKSLVQLDASTTFILIFVQQPYSL